MAERYVTPGELAQALDELEGRQGGLIRQLQGALGGGGVVSGLINTATAAVNGDGFVVVRKGTGDVEITFDVPFSRQVAIVAMPVETVGGLVVKGKDGVPTTPSGARLQVFVPTTLAAADSIICFVAHG